MLMWPLVWVMLKGYFIYPYQEEMKTKNIKLFNNDRGFQKLIDSFQSKGTLESYSKTYLTKLRTCLWLWLCYMRH